MTFPSCNPARRLVTSLVSQYQVFLWHFVVVGSEQRALKIAKPPVWDVVVAKDVSEFAKQGTSLRRFGDLGDLTATPRQYKARYLYILYSFVIVSQPEQLGFFSPNATYQKRPHVHTSDRRWGGPYTPFTQPSVQPGCQPSFSPSAANDRGLVFG